MQTFATGKEEGRLTGQRGQLFWPPQERRRISGGGIDRQVRRPWSGLLYGDPARRLRTPTGEGVALPCPEDGSGGQLTSGIAHDFNNLLLVIVGCLEILQVEVADRPFAQNCVAMAGGDRTRRATQSAASAFARKLPLVPAVMDINALIREETELLRHGLSEPFEVETVLGGGLWKAVVDKGQLKNALPISPSMRTMRRRRAAGSRSRPPTPTRPKLRRAVSRRACRPICAGRRHNVIAVEDGPAVLTVLATIESPDLLFTDVVLPHGMTASRFGGHPQRFPNAAAIFTSGHTRNIIFHKSVDDDT